MSPSKVRIVNNVAIKEVSKNEAKGISAVYPNNTGLLLERPTKLNNDKYELRMRKLTPLNRLNVVELRSLEFTNRAKQMLSNQLNRLHNSGRTHSDLKAQSRHPRLDQKVNGVKRQVLANIENGKVKQMYLSDFDVRNTGDSKADEKRIMIEFIRYLDTLSGDKRRRNSLNSNHNSTPNRLRRRLVMNKRRRNSLNSNHNSTPNPLRRRLVMNNSNSNNYRTPAMRRMFSDGFLKNRNTNVPRDLSNLFG